MRAKTASGTPGPAPLDEWERGWQSFWLVKYSCAFIVMPGGLGTLDELFEAATLVQCKKIGPFPLVLMGAEFWEGLRTWGRPASNCSWTRTAGRSAWCSPATWGRPEFPSSATSTRFARPTRCFSSARMATATTARSARPRRSSFAPSRPQVVLIHGEDVPRTTLAGLIRQRYGLPSVLPKQGDVIDV